MNNTLRTVIFLSALGCSSLSVFAGVIVKSESGEPGAQQKQKTTLYLEAGKLRMETEAEHGKTIMIFAGNTQDLWMLQPEQGTYMEMTADSIARMSSAGGGNPQMEQAMKQMQDRMASMTPEQRAMMEQAMKGGMGAMGGGGAPPTITFQAKGGIEKFGTFTCSKYDELSNGKRTAELCAASFDQLHFTEADLKIFQALGKFMEPLRRMNPRAMAVPPTEQIHGFPVHTVRYDGEKTTSESTVLAVEQKPLDAGLFTVPAGLTKREFPGMGGRGGPPR